MIDTVDNNSLLRNDVKTLGSILGEILVHHGGTELFDKVESIREMTKNIRNEFNEDSYNSLKKKLASLNRLYASK